MARYFLNERHFLDNIWYPAGTVIDWDGPQSEHMVPLEEHLAQRHRRGEGGDGPANRARVISNPSANPPVTTGNDQPAKVALAGPEAPAEAVALPNDERNPDFVRPNLSKPIAAGAEEAADVPPTEPAKVDPEPKPAPAPKTTDAPAKTVIQTEAKPHRMASDHHPQAKK